MLEEFTHNVCCICGESITSGNWARHRKRWHPNEQIKRLPLGTLPSNPLKEDWLNQIQPKELKELYHKAAN